MCVSTSKCTDTHIHASICMHVPFTVYQKIIFTLEPESGMLISSGMALHYLLLIVSRIASVTTKLNGGRCIAIPYSFQRRLHVSVMHQKSSTV